MMSGFETFATRVLILVISVAFVFSSPIIQNGDSGLQRRLFENIQMEKRIPNPAIHGRIMRVLFNDKGDLLNYLTSQIKEEKRQRQCYWSVISCY